MAPSRASLEGRLTGRRRGGGSRTRVRTRVRRGQASREERDPKESLPRDPLVSLRGLGHLRVPRGEELRRELADVVRLGDEGVRGAGRVLEAGHVDVVLARERASGKGVVKIFDYWRAKKEGDSRDSRGKIRNLPLLLQPLFRCPSPSPAGRTPPGTSRGRTRCRRARRCRRRSPPSSRARRTC